MKLRHFFLTQFMWEFLATRNAEEHNIAHSHIGIERKKKKEKIDDCDANSCHDKAKERFFKFVQILGVHRVLKNYTHHSKQMTFTNYAIASSAFQNASDTFHSLFSLGFISLSRSRSRYIFYSVSRHWHRLADDNDTSTNTNRMWCTSESFFNARLKLITNWY